ncbi:MAG: hypothetical protein LBF37_02010 [Rickettsiales bacterium]|jgi:hypothetical protein|nr:hypothetical protein [Rickettsiales bacterium]
MNKIIKFLFAILIAFYTGMSAHAEIVAKSYVDKIVGELSYIPKSEKGAAMGVALLDSESKVPISQIPIGITGGTVAAGNDSRIINAVGKTGDETILGVKTFLTIPVFPTAELPKI